MFSACHYSKFDIFHQKLSWFQEHSTHPTETSVSPWGISGWVLNGKECWLSKSITQGKSLIIGFILSMNDWIWDFHLFLHKWGLNQNENGFICFLEWNIITSLWVRSGVVSRPMWYKQVTLGSLKRHRVTWDFVGEYCVVSRSCFEKKKKKCSQENNSVCANRKCKRTSNGLFGYQG